MRGRWLDAGLLSMNLIPIQFFQTVKDDAAHGGVNHCQRRFSELLCHL